MANCGICNTPTKSKTVKWFQYDNGEQFRTTVCVKCANWHTNQTEKGQK